MFGEQVECRFKNVILPLFRCGTRGSPPANQAAAPPV
jgi:hypothetical protein